MGTSQATQLAVLAFVCSCELAAAQPFPDAGAKQTLLGARSLKCSFPWYAQADWEQDQPKVKSAVQEEFAFHIDGIDLGKGGARLIGNAGAEDLVALPGATSVSFIERTPSGAVNLTTVYAWRDKSGGFKTVHSRHTAIGGPSPSQNYGFCQVW